MGAEIIVFIIIYKYSFNQGRCICDYVLDHWEKIIQTFQYLYRPKQITYNIKPFATGLLKICCTSEPPVRLANNICLVLTPQSF